MIEPRKVKKSQRPRFRGKGLLTEGYFRQFEPIHIPPQFNYARLLLKETLIPNPINNTIEVSGHFAVSATLSNMSKKKFRPWKLSMGGYGTINGLGIFDARIDELITSGGIGFLSFNFPDQGKQDKQYIDLPIPDKYVSGICDVRLDRIPLEKMVKSTGNLKPLTNFTNAKDHLKYLNLMNAPVFVSSSVAGTDDYNTQGATGIRVSPYENQETIASPISLSVECEYTRSITNMESNGHRLVLHYGKFNYNELSTILRSYKYIYHSRLGANNSDRVGMPYLQFYQYRYTITLKHPENEEDVFSYIQDRYIITDENDPKWSWGKPVKDFILREEPRADGFDNINLGQLIDRHMTSLSDDYILYELADNEEEYRARVDFLSLSIRPSWRNNTGDVITLQSDIPRDSLFPRHFSQDSWFTFDNGQNVFDWIKSKITTVNWNDGAGVRKFKEDYETNIFYIEHRLGHQEATSIIKAINVEEDWTISSATNAYVGDSPRNYEDPQGIRNGLFYMYMYIRGREGTLHSGESRISAPEYPTGGGMSRFKDDWITIIPQRQTTPVKIARILYNYSIRDNTLYLPIENMSRVDAAKYLIDNYYIDDIKISCARIVIEDGYETMGESYDHTGVNLISALMEIAEHEDEAGN